MIKQSCFGMTLMVVLLGLTVTIDTPMTLFAQVPGLVAGSGMQFMLCFERNMDTTLDLKNGDRSFNFGCNEIWLASPNDTTTVTITCRRYPSMYKVFHLAKGSSIVYRITADTIVSSDGTIDTLKDMWITSSEQVDNRVVQVVSTAPIVCYGMNYKYFSADAFHALPFLSTGTDYRVLSFESQTLFQTPSQFAVVAFMDSTQVTITPSAPTLRGHVAGVPFTVMLDQGQTFQVQTVDNAGGFDLTGSEVHSDKPIAVYAGQAKTSVPPSDGSDCDVLLEAMPPVRAWGKVYALSAFGRNPAGDKDPGGDLVRVLSAYPNTILTINGKFWTTVGANEWIDRYIHGPVLIEASQPILVGEYAHTYDGTDNGKGYGDPFLAIVPPIDQAFSDYTFFVSDDSLNLGILPHTPSDTLIFPVQKVIIATDVAAQSSIVLDGNISIPASAFTALPVTSTGRAFAVAEWNISPGLHTLHTDLPPEQGFTAMVYGLGNVVSYGYGIYGVHSCGWPLTPIDLVTTTNGKTLSTPSSKPFDLHLVLKSLSGIFPVWAGIDGTITYNSDGVTLISASGVNGWTVTSTPISSGVTQLHCVPSVYSTLQSGEIIADLHFAPYITTSISSQINFENITACGTAAMTPVEISANGCGDSMLSRFMATGKLLYGIRTYPNPAHGVITAVTSIPSGTTAILSLYNALGQCVGSYGVSSVVGGESTTIADLSPSIYFLRLYAAGSRNVATSEIVVTAP